MLLKVFAKVVKVKKMKKEISNLGLELEDAFNQIGSSMMSDDFASKLLAWFMVYGGGNESTIIDEKLNFGIRLAQKKANIYGGEIPKYDLIKKMQERIGELKQNGKKTEWLNELIDRYGKTILQGE